MKPYSTLTMRGQARRLRVLALNALKCYQLAITRVSLVTNDMNGIFRVDTKSGEKYILRVTLPEGGHTLDHMIAEMDWLAALANETDLRVPRPVAAMDGSLVVEAQAPGVPEPRFCVIFSWVPGKDLVDDMTDVNIANLGGLMAKLHAHAQAYNPPDGLSLLQFDRVFPFPEPVVLFHAEYASLFKPQRREIYERVVAWTQESIDRLKKSGESMRVLHGDLHQWNVRIYRGVLSPIDFEDLMLGWPVQDIATTLYYFGGQEYARLRSAFQDGYTSHSPWPERVPGEIDSFIAARGIGLVNFILNDPNPEWKRQAPEFIERVEKRLRELMD